MLAVSRSNMAWLGRQEHISSPPCLSFTSRQAQECTHSTGKGQEQASLLAQILVKLLLASYLLISYWLKQVKVSWSGWALQNYRAKGLEIGWSEELEPVPAVYCRIFHSQSVWSLILLSINHTSFPTCLPLADLNSLPPFLIMGSFSLFPFCNFLIFS